MPNSLEIIAGQFSDKGVKAFNEDSCAIRVPEEPLLTTKGIVIAIADGVSSSSAGREASEACIKGFISDYYSTPESWTVKSSGQKVLGAINHWLFGQSQKLKHSGQGLLTTFSALIIKSTTAYLFHVGDSRIYRLRKGEFERLTTDHSRWGSDKNIFLSRAMGADSHVEIDFRCIDVENDDVFFLSTDGVHEYVRTQHIQTIIEENHHNPERASKELIKQALKNGSDDNVTCQIVRVCQTPAANEESFYQKLTELPFPPTLDATMKLDGYKIIRELHASNRTQVYLASDLETGQKVVIKTPSVNYEDDPGYIDSFLSEEWAGRRISNPHVLRVLTPSKQRHFLYYITEYVEGQTLRQWMDDNPRPSLSDVRDIISQVIKGTRALKRQEMVHQDLKPQNIMIDKSGTVKIIDFGSTRVAGIEEISKPVSDKPVLGTMEYSAPEYFLGYPGTYASDVYSVGVICYELLSGKLPYGKAFSRRNIKQLNYVPLHTTRDDIPPWLNGAIRKCVSVNPKDRYGTLSEFLQDLSQPNMSLCNEFQPILDTNPLLFWKTLAVMLFLINIILVIYLLQSF